MKRTLLILLLSLLHAGNLSAKNVTIEQARQTASQFWQSSAATRSGTPSWQLVFHSEQLETRTSGTAPSYYVFDNTSGPGFVIVAGDDVAMPVLGYSFEHEFPNGPLPSNLKEWLDNIRETVNKARSSGLRAENEVSQAWASTRSGNIVIQLETAFWDQAEPYNLLCPTYSGIPTYTGCTITALAIAMRYHQWPQKGNGTLPAYITSSYGISVPSLQLGHTYDWDNMLMNYNGSYTQNQALAVATLMRDCGIMLQADYGPIGSSGTGASISNLPQLLSNYMDYDKQIRWIYRERYSTTEWNEMLRNELNNRRPVIYSGYNDTAGHAFILDGYTDNNYYSVNWGWSGHYNGYFLLTALNPDGQGIGGSDHYNDSQQAIIGIQKDVGNSQIEELRLVNYTSTEGEFKGFSITGEIEVGKRFNFSLGLVYNSGNTTYDGDILIAVADREGTIVEQLKMLSEKLEPNQGTIHYLYATINGPIRAGYRIRSYFRSSDNTWTLIRGNDESGCIWEVPIADDYTIEESTELSYDRTGRKMRLRVKEGVTVSLLAADGRDFSGVCQVQGQEIDIDASKLEGGKYRLILKKGSEEKELQITFASAE